MKELIKKYFDLNEYTTTNADGIAERIEELTESCYAARNPNELSYLMGYLGGIDDASALTGGDTTEYLNQMSNLSKAEFVAWLDYVTEDEDGIEEE